MVAEIFLFPDLLELEMGESQMSSLVLLGPLAPMTPLGLTSRRSNYAGTTRCLSVYMQEGLMLSSSHLTFP